LKAKKNGVKEKSFTPFQFVKEPQSQQSRMGVIWQKVKQKV
jgi:hypothetical protein